ncbi:Imm40 family immunity protein [Prevotella fusca]
MKNDIISIIQDNDISEYYSLKHSGVEGYAFPDHEALRIVQLCKLLLIPILGGDVYSLNDSTIESLDDNWYYDRTPSESYYVTIQR